MGKIMFYFERHLDWLPGFVDGLIQESDAIFYECDLSDHSPEVKRFLDAVSTGKASPGDSEKYIDSAIDVYYKHVSEPLYKTGKEVIVERGSFTDKEEEKLENLAFSAIQSTGYNNCSRYVKRFVRKKLVERDKEITKQLSRAAKSGKTITVFLGSLHKKVMENLENAGFKCEAYYSHNAKKWDKQAKIFFKSAYEKGYKPSKRELGRAFG